MESLFILCSGVVFIIMLYLLYHYKDRITTLEAQIETLDHTDDVLVEFNGKIANRLAYYDAQIHDLQVQQRQSQLPGANFTQNTQQSSNYVDQTQQPYSNLVIMRSFPTTVDRTNETIDLSDLDEDEVDDDEDDDRLDLGDEEVSLSEVDDVFTTDDVSGERTNNMANIAEGMESISLDEMVTKPEPENQIEEPKEPTETKEVVLLVEPKHQPDYSKMSVPDLRKLITSKALKPASECIKMKKTELVQVLQNHDRRSL